MNGSQKTELESRVPPDWLADTLGHDATGPLSHLTFLTIGQSLAVDFGSVLLADLGACVVRIELEPDEASAAAIHSSTTHNPLGYAAENRGKYSIIVDTTDRDSLFKLAAGADGLLDGVGYQGLETLGIGPQSLFEHNPRLRILRISAFGQTGPLAGECSDDRVAQSYSGMTHVTGFEDGPPMPVPVPLAEYWTGLFGAGTLLMSLLDPAQEGDVIDLALYETSLRFQEEAILQFDLTGVVRTRMGNDIPEQVPASHYRAKDGRWVAISAATDDAWARMCAVMGHPQHADDERLKSAAARIANRSLVNEIVSGYVASRDASTVLAELAAINVPVSIIATVADLFKHEHASARRDFIDVPLEDGGTVKMVAPYPRFSSSELRVHRPAPWRGEHSHLLQERP